MIVGPPIPGSFAPGTCLLRPQPRLDGTAAALSSAAYWPDIDTLRIGLAVGIVCDQVGINLGYFLSDQPVLQGARIFVVLKLVEEGTGRSFISALLLSPISRIYSLKREQTVVPSSPIDCKRKRKYTARLAPSLLGDVGQYALYSK